MTTRNTQDYIKVLKRVASPITASVVLILVFISITSVRDSESAGDEFVQVQQAFRDFPEEIRSGDAIWLQTRRVPVPTGQAELLGKSAFMSREYVRLRTFPQVTAILFLVYCVESRMMAGHHPPNCYPSSGWNLLDGTTTSLSVPRADGRTIEAEVYQFSRPNNLEDDLLIVSGFFLGDGRFFSTLGAANEGSRPSLLGGSGMFQFQILLQGGLSEVDVRRYGRELLSGIPNDVFDEIISKRDSIETASNLGGVP